MAMSYIIDQQKILFYKKILNGNDNNKNNSLICKASYDRKITSEALKSTACHIER